MQSRLQKKEGNVYATRKSEDAKHRMTKCPIRQSIINDFPSQRKNFQLQNKVSVYSEMQIGSHSS